MKYKQIYPWQALDIARNGKDVLIVDFELDLVSNIKDLTVRKYLDAITHTEKYEDDRYVMVVVSEEEDEKDETL